MAWPGSHSPLCSPRVIRPLIWRYKGLKAGAAVPPGTPESAATEPAGAESEGVIAGIEGALQHSRPHLRKRSCTR